MNPNVAKPRGQSQHGPFAVQFSDAFPGVLDQLGGTLALTTYQAGKIALVSPGRDGLVLLLRTFPGATGIAVRDQQLAVASGNEIILFDNARLLADGFPRSPGRFDALFLPYTRHLVGNVDVHDLALDADGRLLFVNTLCSCIATSDARNNFVSLWKPWFISSEAPDDRCHLNGFATSTAGKPTFATIFAQSNTAQGWRHAPVRSGALIDIDASDIVLDGLDQPHSPRLKGQSIYLLESGSGSLLQVDARTGASDVVVRLPGFLRGLCIVKNHAFVGSSRLRDNSKKDADTGGASVFCVALDTGSVIAELRFLRDCSEIYDLAFLPGVHRPNVLGPDDPLLGRVLRSPGFEGWAQAKDDEKTRRQE